MKRIKILKFSGEWGELKEKNNLRRQSANKIYEYVNNSLKIGHDIPLQTDHLYTFNIPFCVTLDFLIQFFIQE